MGHYDGRCIFMAAFDVNKVNINIINRCFVLGVLVQAILGVVPVVVAGPVFTKLPVILDGYSLTPVFDRFGIRPPGSTQSTFQVVYFICWNIQFEYRDFAH